MIDFYNTTTSITVDIHNPLSGEVIDQIEEQVEIAIEYETFSPFKSPVDEYGRPTDPDGYFHVQIISCITVPDGIDITDRFSESQFSKWEDRILRDLEPC